VSLRRPDLRINVADYIEGEKDSPIRHEYLDGHIYAMAGASDRHNRIALNIASWLNEHLSMRPLSMGPCETFISDMKVKVNERIYYYPDVMVSCDPAMSDAYFRSQPIVIVEVTSPTTERVDHHEKMLAYRQVESLREHVLVSQDQIRVEAHRRNRGDWKAEMLTRPDDVLTLESVGLSISIADIYRNVRLEAV
jgi:Uma2 family endonuclease